jgi:hypothetical protein
MSEPPRIVLADPSEEGKSIAEALRGRGYLVSEEPIASLVTEGAGAALILLAGDVSESIEALAALADVDDLPPIVLLGHPDDAEDREVTSVRPLGADAHYARPVSLERLLRKVETLLSPPETRLAPPPPSESPETPLSTPPAPSREPTLIQAPGDEWGDEGDGEEADEEGVETSGGKLDDLFEEAEVSGVAEVTGISFRDEIPSLEAAASLHDPDNPVSQVARRSSRPPPSETAAVLSPRLATIFSEADRRVFPEGPPIDLELPDRQESARELVPDNLLEVVVMPAETREEDPLDAFTYVGVVPPELIGAPLPLPEAAQRFQPQSMTGELPPARPARTQASDAVRPSRPPRTVAQSDSVDIASLPSAPQISESLSGEVLHPEAPDEPTRDEPTRESLEQHGTVDGTEVIRFLMSIAESQQPVDARLTLADGSRVSLTVAGRHLKRLVADVHVLAVRELQRSGRVDEAPTDEQAAAQLLNEQLRGGLVGKFEADRLLRRARETRIHDLVSADSLEMDVEGADEGEADPSLLASPLPAVVAEGARRRIDPARLRVLFGGGDLVIELGEGLDAAGNALELEPEVMSAVRRADGASIDTFLDAAPVEEGLAGALLALHSTGAVFVRARSADHTGVVLDPQTSVRALVEAAHTLAEEGCYFDVLGAPPDARPRELRAAYETRRNELAQLDLEAVGLPELTTKRDEAIEVVDEAWEILRDEELNRAYRRSLGL